MLVEHINNARGAYLTMSVEKILQCPWNIFNNPGACLTMLLKIQRLEL